MSENLRLYSTIMSFIGSNMSFNDLRNHVTFGWMVVGLLMSQQIHLNLWALHRQSAAQASSRERQMSRWLHNAKIETGKLYRALITAALVEWQEATVVMALDTSVLWNRFVLVRIALIYRGRALPLVWTVLEQSSASVAFAQYSQLLQQAALLLPLGCRPILLADRGFVDVDLMRLAAELGWHFTIRTKQNVWVYRAFKARCKVNRLMPPQGQIHLFHTVQVTQRRFVRCIWRWRRCAPPTAMKPGRSSATARLRLTRWMNMPCASTSMKTSLTINRLASVCTRVKCVPQKHWSVSVWCWPSPRCIWSRSARLSSHSTGVRG